MHMHYGRAPVSAPDPSTSYPEPSDEPLPISSNDDQLMSDAHDGDWAALVDIKTQVTVPRGRGCPSSAQMRCPRPYGGVHAYNAAH